MRLFVAVRLPSELTDRAAALLPAALPAIKPVRAELMHITLAFLGWTLDEQLDAVVAAARDAATGQPTFDRTRVDRIAVVESVLSPKGPRYTARVELPLG